VYPTTTGADRLIEQVIVATSGQTWTSSFFVKASGFSWVLVYSPNLGTCWFNASTGSFGTIAAGVTATVLGQVNGFWRVSFTGTIASGNAYFYAGPANANNSTTATTSGTNGLLFWGCQLELGAYATSYIPTLASASTRSADACSKTGISSLIGQTEGVIFIDFVYTNPDSNGLIPITIGTDSSNLAYILIDGSNQITFDFVVAGAATGRIQTAGGYAVKGTRYKFAFAYKANDFAAYINGQLIGTDNSGAITALSNFYFGYPYAAGYSTPNTVNQSLLFKTRLTNAQLAELTTL
jgi:hypothetical protein